MKAAVEELIRVYRASLLLADAPAVDPTRDTVSQGKGGHGKHGTTTTTPGFGADVPLCVDMERALTRFVAVYRRRLEVEAQGSTARPSHDRRGSAKRQEDRAILDAVGEDPTALAFVYGRTTEGVRKLRTRNGLDADTGERLRTERPITAPARETFQHHERTTTTEA